MTKPDKKSTIRWFGSWSNEYDSTLGKISFHKGLLNLAVHMAKIKKGQKVLDIGCGTGLLTLKLLKAGDCSVTGIDGSEKMLAIFKKKIKALNLGQKITCKLMDASALRLADNTFDCAVSTVVLHHIKDKLKTLRGIYRVLKPGGRLIIGEVDMDTTGSLRDVKRLKRIVGVLTEEWTAALKDVGVEAFARMFVNGKKHILNEGEYCVSFRQWARLCRDAGFKDITIKAVPHYKSFKVLSARKKNSS